MIMNHLTTLATQLARFTLAFIMVAVAAVCCFAQDTLAVIELPELDTPSSFVWSSNLTILATGLTLALAYIAKFVPSISGFKNTGLVRAIVVGFVVVSGIVTHKVGFFTDETYNLLVSLLPAKVVAYAGLLYNIVKLLRDQIYNRTEAKSSSKV
jgi:hypothetical protein